jgi:ArsR family transcriptional regulator
MFEEPSDEEYRILDILGNETRRRILRLLAQEPRYFIQLSRDLGVSQQAILKHLELLERAGFVSPYSAKSDLPAPKRKYYRLNRSIYMSIGITEDDVSIRLRDIAPHQDDVNLDLKDATISETIDESDESSQELSVFLRSSRDLLKRLDERVGELEQHKVSLLKLRQTVMKRVHDAVRSNFDDPLERSILYSLMTSSEALDVALLSERLNVREKEIERSLETLGQRLALSLV